MFFLFFFKQKTAYEMRISDWSSDVCSSDLLPLRLPPRRRRRAQPARDVRARRTGADAAQDSRRERDRRRRRRTRRADLRPCEERLLVWLAAIDPRDPQAGALPERDRPDRKSTRLNSSH